jgi:hypothetical protein
MSDAEVLGPDEPGPRNTKDANYGENNGRRQDNGGAARTFPWERLALTAVFAVVAWFMFWVTLFLAVAAGGLKLAGIEASANVAGYARKSSNYLASVLTFVSGATDEAPFPFG